MDMGKDLVAASTTPLVLVILAEGDSYGYAIINPSGRVVRGVASLDRWHALSRAAPA